MKNIWAKVGEEYFQQESSFQVDVLPPHVFRLEKSPSGYYLVEMEEEFTFNHKIYNTDQSLIERVAKSFKELKGNLGVLLSGIKGSGKTVTAKLICNKIKIPVIVVTRKYEDVSTFINSLQQEAIIFFDEYEKIYTDYNANILTVMDGVLNSSSKKLFLMTTNETQVNSNMLQRPGRIRYFKTYGDMDIETIMEVVDDRLTYKEAREETIKFIAGLDTITLDVVKAIVDEVNLFEETPDKFAKVFNVKPLQEVFDIYHVKGDKEELMHKKVSVTIPRIDKRNIGWSLSCSESYLGEIENVLPDGKVVIKIEEEDEDGDETGNTVLKTIRIDRHKTYHSSFYGYDF